MRLAYPAATITRHPLYTAHGFMLSAVEAGSVSFVAFAGTIFGVAFLGHVITSPVNW